MDVSDIRPGREGPGATDEPKRILDRKVGWSRLALYAERMWPRIWPLVALFAAFFLVSLFGIWPALGQIPHVALLSLFGLGLLASLVFMLMTRWPTREEAIRRIEMKSGVPHRPATSYEDTLDERTADPTTRAVWAAHRRRLAEKLKGLRIGAPAPDTARRDPWALRAVVILLVGVAMMFLGDRAADRLGEAFAFRTAKLFASARIDAWVAPPAYTRKAPVMLADGGRPEEITGAAAAGVIEVPETSELIARASGVPVDDLRLEILTEDAEPVIVSAKEPGTLTTATANVAEIRYALTENARVRLLIADAEAARWTFAVTPDNPPVIAMTKDPEIARRGSMKLTYKVTDDYGIASARAKVVRRDAEEADPATAWARKDVLKGPRPPLERPPELNLRVPRGGENAGGEAITHLEIGSHPWAGLEVEMTLEATDVAGKVGRSKPIRLKMPERHFQNPFARAVVEQRRKLVADPRYREEVVKALDALTIEPEAFIDDVQVYLGLRTVYYRLQNQDTRKNRSSAIEQLWQIALRIEDGDLSDAERRLRDAQDRLSKMLEEGASEAEIAEAMRELRQALNEYMEQLARQAQDNPMQPPNGQDSQNQFLSEQDLDRMMRELEDMAKSGAREQAQQMLSEMRDLLDRLQSGQMANQQSEQSRQMQQAMKDLGDLVGQQKRLMDDTHGQQRQQGQQGDRGGQQQNGMQQPGQGQQRRGPQGRGQSGQEGEQGQSGQTGPAGRSGQDMSANGLRDRQNALRQRLRDLQNNLGQQGSPSPEQLGNAEDAMERAEEALEGEDYPEATRQQSRALEEMRKGAQQMAQQMMQNSPQRYGQNGDAQRDPLGRPQRSEGPDQGTSVKVPDQIDIQRAREILEELRRRLGDPNRPSLELDYIERLLERF